MLGGRFKAARVDMASSPLIQKTTGLSSLFQSRLAETPKKPLPTVLESNDFSSENSLSDPSLEKKEDV